MALQTTTQVKQWIVSVSSERWFAHNMKHLCRVSRVLNAVPHFSFSDESELQVREFLYKEKLQLCLCFVETYVEFYFHFMDFTDYWLVLLRYSCHHALILYKVEAYLACINTRTTKNSGSQVVCYFDILNMFWILLMYFFYKGYSKADNIR